MRFIGSNGILAKARRFVSTSPAVSEADVTEPKKLAEILRNLCSLVAKLENKSGPEAVEIEADVSTGAAKVYLRHSLNSPIRFYVTHWSNSTGAPSLVWSSDSTPDMLVLKSYVAGRAVIRIEPVQSAPGRPA